MKVLVVNHGYPMRFNAGSEIYTENLVNGLLSEGIDVQVFSRDENPFTPDYVLTTESRSYNNLNYQLNLINVPRQKDRYQSDGVDRKFADLLDKFQPDIVHFNHLNHLSLGIVDVAYQKQIRIVFTLHDFWLACPRGQFLQINYGENQAFQLCDGQEDRKCAIHCYSRYHSGLKSNETDDIEYWKKWVHRRQETVKEIISKVDLFIAPSPSLLDRMKDELDIPNDKIMLLDYGFELERLKNRSRTISKEVVFGYIGTHIVSKGIHHFLEAFSEIKGDAKLLIFGRSRSETTPYLQSYYTSNNIVWLDEYENKDIVSQVFNKVDVIVVPSIWAENSPLVIHEAQQVRIPVIAGNTGGMADYVKHEVNGLLFTHRDPKSLRDQMQKVVDNPDLVKKLGERGYLHSETGDIPSLQAHTTEMITLYKEVLK